MNTLNTTPFRAKAIALAIISTTSTAYGFEITTSNPDLRLSLDNTVKYSTAYRLKSSSPGLTQGQTAINLNDGDNNFHRGLVSNRLDLLSELDLSYKDYGARISAAAWYDDVYHHHTDNANKDFRANHTPASEFSNQTKRVMGGC
nr:DUF1302 family protein [Marinomonas spartinae]